jgi:hypothetical protein
MSSSKHKARSLTVIQQPTATFKIAVFWSLTPCGLAEKYQRLGGIGCLGLQDERVLEVGDRRNLRNMMTTKLHGVASQGTAVRTCVPQLKHFHV